MSRIRTAHRPLAVRIALLAVLALVAAACAAEGTGNQAGESPAQTSDATGGETAATDEGTGDGSGDEGPIEIGVNIEQSGDASVQGEAYARAATLLAERINSNGGVLGREINLNIVDNGTDQTEAVTLTRQLANEGVAAMIGPGTSPTTLAAMDTILETGIPTFSMGSSSAIVEPASEHPNVFKTPVGSEANAQKILDDLERRGITQVGLISVNNPYGDSGIQAWQQLNDSADYDFELVGNERFERGDTDMTPQLSNLVDAGAEAIVTVAIPPGAPTVRRNAVNNLNIDMPMYFDAGAGAELFIELAGEAANGAFVAHPPTLIWDEVSTETPQGEALREFGEAYTEEYGAMSGFAGYAWDALGMLTTAMEEVGSAEPQAVVDALEGLNEYPGVDGVYNLSSQDHQGLGADDLRLLTVEDGEWTEATQ
jgi:branched-chain amino acid transport system substrate-binding protein